MKIKLFYSPRLYEGGKFGYQRQPSYVPPLGMSTVTSFLNSNGHTATQDDMDIKAFSMPRGRVDMHPFDDRKRISGFISGKDDEELISSAERLLKETRYKGNDAIGFSISDDHNFSAIGSTVVLSKIIKEETGASILIGGVRHQRTIYEQSLTDLPYIDFVVMQDHRTTLRLLNALDKEAFSKSDLIDIAYNKERMKRYAVSDGKPEDDVPHDMLPYPDFDGLPLDLYTPDFSEPMCSPARGRRMLMLPFAFVNGCLQGCAFCPNSEKPMLRKKEPEEVAHKLKEYSVKYRTKYFMFLNTNVNPTYEYAERLVDELIDIDAGIMWSDCANLKQLDRKLLAKIRESGGIRLVYGLESASPRMLKYINKGITRERAAEMLHASDEAGIWNELELIAGMPTETESDVNDTCEFIKANKKDINYFYLAKYMLMNSAIRNDPDKYGIENIEDNAGSLDKIRPFSRRFDEKGGLRWEDKEKQIGRSYDQICRSLSDTGRPDQWVNQGGYDSQGSILHLLYVLYDQLGDKKKVSGYFSGFRQK